MASTIPSRRGGTRYIMVEVLSTWQDETTRTNGTIITAELNLDTFVTKHVHFICVLQKASGISKCRRSTKVRLREQVHAVNTNGAAVEAIFIEPFKTQLVAADARGKVRVFDYLQSKLINEFDSNRELPSPSSIANMYRLNDLYNEILLSCSRNGSVVAWRYYNRPGCEIPATSWQAIDPEVRPGRFYLYQH